VLRLRSGENWDELYFLLSFWFHSHFFFFFGRKWFERTSKRLFTEIYPYSTIEFCFSNGWFSWFLHRNDITLRIITNQASETPAQHCEMIINFLCFKRWNSQLRDGSEDTVCPVGRYLTSNIINMDQTPLPWEYLEGRSYETKGNKTV